MIVWWIGNVLLLVVVAPVVWLLLRNTLTASSSIPPRIDAIATVATAASKDLDAAALLLTTQEQAIKTVGVVADYGGSLDVILDDHR
jgi:hypothetical protein